MKLILRFRYILLLGAAYLSQIQISAQNNNDLKLQEIILTSNLDSNYSQYYSKVPLSQVVKDTLHFNGVVKNVGVFTQTNTIVSGGFTSPIANYPSVSGAVNINAGFTDSLGLIGQLVFTDGMGNYSFAFETSSDSVDDNPLDNYSDTILVEVTDTTFARDVNSGGNHRGGPGTNIEAGVSFTILDTIKAVSITVGIGDSTLAGEVISVYLYDAAFNYITTTEFVTIQTHQVGNLFSIKIPETLLLPGKYLVSVKTYSEEVYLQKSSIAADSNTVFEDVGATGSWTSSNVTPLVRLNVSNNLWVCDLVANAVQIARYSGLAMGYDGTPPYRFIWDTGDTTARVDGLQYGVGYKIEVTDSVNCMDAVIFYLVNGVKEGGFNGNISVFPNPNNGNFVFSMEGIASGKYLLEIFNSIGQKIDEQQFIVNGTYSEKKNLIGMNLGLYYLKLTNSIGKQVTRTMVVE